MSWKSEENTDDSVGKNSRGRGWILHRQEMLKSTHFAIFPDLCLLHIIYADLTTLKYTDLSY